jgi:hypothetical protein
MPARRVLPWLLVLSGACGSPPPSRQSAPPPEAVTAVHTPEIDDCAPVDGKLVEPLVRKYDGVAAAARCQREVYTIMGFVTRALGQPCGYCHVGEDFPKMTHRKVVANWMARELVPRLSKHGGGDVWCKDCHAASGKGRAKILGDPRSRSWAIEWMSTHLVERFDTAQGDPLRCTMCHVGNVGSPGWDPKVILTDHLPPKPPSATPSDAEASELPDAGASTDSGVPQVADAGTADGG